MTRHPEREALDRFLRGRISEAEAARIERHLAEERCVSCLFLARELMAESEPDLREGLHRFTRGMLETSESARHEAGQDLDAALRLAERRAAVIAAERALAPELLAELETRSPAARRDAIRTGRRYQLFGLAEHLADQSREQGFRDVARAVELAELAVEVADTLDPRIYVAIVASEQQALARACLGNARRIASDLHAAERAFQESLLLLEKGSAVSPVRGEVWSLLGSLRIDQGRYAEARRVLSRALETFHDFEYPTHQAKVLIKLANVEGYAGNPERAVEILQRAAPHLEGTGERRLLAWVHHNLTDCLVDAGQALEALARYEKARPLYDEHFGEPSLRLRRRWLEGRIYAGLGELDLAREAFEEVRATAAERELSYELAMVSLELAVVYLNAGDTGRVRELAEEMGPIFASRDLHAHALGAMYLVRRAARTETATVELLQEAFRYLRRARNNPFARFEPSGRLG